MPVQMPPANIKNSFVDVFWSELVIRLGFAEICMCFLLSVCVSMLVISAGLRLEDILASRAMLRL